MDYADLLVRSAAKDQQAFKALYDGTSSLLFSVLMRFLQDRALAEDVLQESFMKIWEKASSYSPEKSAPMTWMSTIARNAARDKLRAMKVRHYQEESSEPLEVLCSDDASPEKQMMVEKDMAAVNQALQKMSDSQRKCMIMSCYQGYTHSEVAAKMGMPLGTIKSWVRRGKDQMLGLVLQEC